MGGEKAVVKAAHERVQRGEDFVLVNAGELFGELALWDLVVVVQARLRPPADMKGGIDVGFAPVHNGLEFLPVVHVFKVEQFNRGAGDDHAVELLIPDVVERFVERIQVGGGGVFGNVGSGLQQLNIHL